MLVEQKLCNWTETLAQPCFLSASLFASRQTRFAFSAYRAQHDTASCARYLKRLRLLNTLRALSESFKLGIFKRNKNAAKRSKSAKQHVSWLSRYSNTFFMMIFIPISFLGTIYLLLFFVLNTSFGTQILNGQLTQFLRGDFEIDRISTDPILYNLTLHHAQLREAGKKECVIEAEKIVAKIPILELQDLVTKSTFTLGKVTVYNGIVNLDFSQGELNILKVVLPYKSKPEPPDDSEGGTTIWLSNLNVSDTVVNLIFDGFHIDLRHVDVDSYAIRAGEILEMFTPEWHEGQKRPIKVGEGDVVFNPATFSFALADIGDASEGLIFSGGSGAAGKMGYAYSQMARRTANILRDETGWIEKLGAKPDMRGNFVAPIKNTLINGFFWKDARFDIPGMITEVGNGGLLKLEHAFMNTGPKQEEIEQQSIEYNHKPSGLLPEESILWGASIDLDLPVEDPIIQYFFGPVLKGSSHVNVKAAMAGDLQRVSGDVAVDIPPFETFGVNVNHFNLRANMDGQDVKIQALQADTTLGAVLAAGHYYIFDGDFNIDLWAGKKPSVAALKAIQASSTPHRDSMPPNSIAEALATTVEVDEEFLARLDNGLAPMKMEALNTPLLRQFGGNLETHLKLTSNQGKMAVALPDGIDWAFKDPFAGIENVKIETNTPNGELVAYQNGILESPGGIRIEAGKDSITINPGLHLNTASLSDLSDISIDLKAHIEDPMKYTERFGLEDVHASAVDLSAALDTSGSRPSGRLMLTTNNLGYENWVIKNVGIDLDLNDGKLTTRRFEIATDFARVTGSVQADVTTEQLSRPQTIPFDAKANVTDLNFEKIPLEELTALNLKGTATAEITAKGPVDKIKANVSYTMDNIHVLDDDLSKLMFRMEYADNVVSMPLFGIWIDPLNTEQMRFPDLSINTLTFNLDTMAVSFNTAMQPVSPNRFNAFKALDIPLDGKISFDLTGNVDVGKIISGEIFEESRKAKNTKVFESTWIEGEVKLADASFGDLNLGNTELLLSRSKQFMLLKGILADALEIQGFVRTSPKLTASASINFHSLEALDLLDQLNIDVNDLKHTFKLKSAITSGSIGFCMKDLSDMKVSVIIDNFDADVLQNHLKFNQSAIANYDLKTGSFNLYRLDLGFRDSTLKLSGSGDLDGKLNLDVNGEIDAALATAFPTIVSDASGLLGISLSANGSYLNSNGEFDLSALNLSGYLGVRDPISLRTSYSSIPIYLQQGFLVMDKNSPECRKDENCLYTPENQQFMLGAEGQWLNLKLLLKPNALFNVSLDGTLDVKLAESFVKDISSSRGKLALNVNANGNLKDALDGNFAKLNAGASLAVSEPITIEMNSLSEPIEVKEGGALRITDASQCPSRTDCILIDKNEAFSGNLMGGTFLIFGEVTREDFINLRNTSLSITANNVNFRMKDELSLTLSPDIQITADDLTAFENVKVSGNIDVAEARYNKDFDDGDNNIIRDAILSYVIDSKKRVEAYSPSFLRKWPFLSKMNLDINVSAESSIDVDVKIASAVVDLNLGTQLKIGGTIKDILPTGIVSITEGSLAFKDNEFEFQSGAQIAFNNSMDGKIDMVATAEINTESSAFSSVLGSTDLDRRKRISTNDATAGSTLYSITLNVGGSLFSPQWSFDSSPYLTDTNIYALILTGRTIEDFSGNDVAMESLLSPLFSSQLDTIINADQFKFLFTEGAAQFVYVKQINKGLRIAAGVSIRGAEGNEQALSAEYFFNDNWFIDFTGQNTADEVGRAPTFKLGARLHWHLPID